MTSIIRRHSSVSAPSTGPSSITPALLTSASMPAEPVRARASTNPRAWSSAATSTVIAVGGAALGLDLLRERLDAVRAPRAERDGGAGLRAQQRGRLADPRGGAGDRHHLAGEVVSHGATLPASGRPDRRKPANSADLCNISFRVGARGGIGRRIPTARVRHDGLRAICFLGDHGRPARGNYDSGEDFVLEYGELRFTFNERDFSERCEQAGAQARLRRRHARRGASSRTSSTSPSTARSRSPPPRSASTSTTAGPSSSAPPTARSCTGCGASSSAPPGSTSASRRASSTCASTTSTRPSATSSPTAATSRSSWRPSPPGAGSPTSPRSAA